MQRDEDIAGMRDKVIHQYERVKIAVVWQALAIDIPQQLMLELSFWPIAYGSKLILKQRRKNYGSQLSWGLR